MTKLKLKCLLYLNTTKVARDRISKYSRSYNN